MAPAIALFAALAAIVGLQESPKSACGPVSSSESRNCTQRCPSELSTLCDAHKDVPAALLGFEEDSLWIPRLDEFNSCTGSRISLTYTLLGELGMADALEADCGTVAPTPSEGAGIYDGYVVQAPWVPNVEPLLENLSPRIAATPEIDWLDINPDLKGFDVPLMSDKTADIARQFGVLQQCLGQEQTGAGFPAVHSCALDSRVAFNVGEIARLSRTISNASSKVII